MYPVYVPIYKCLDSIDFSDKTTIKYIFEEHEQEQQQKKCWTFTICLLVFGGGNS